MGDIERLDRKIEDVRDTVRGLVSRLVTTGFGPGALPYGGPPISSGTGTMAPTAFTGPYTVAFPGSIVAVSVIADATLSGSAGVDYVDFEVYVDSAATGLIARVDGGTRKKSAVQDKGLDVFTINSEIELRYSVTGTPGSHSYNAIVWVALN